MFCRGVVCGVGCGVVCDVVVWCADSESGGYIRTGEVRERQSSCV